MYINIYYVYIVYIYIYVCVYVFISESTCVAGHIHVSCVTYTARYKNNSKFINQLHNSCVSIYLTCYIVEK